MLRHFPALIRLTVSYTSGEVHDEVLIATMFRRFLRKDLDGKFVRGEKFSTLEYLVNGLNSVCDEILDVSLADSFKNVSMKGITEFLLL